MAKVVISQPMYFPWYGHLEQVKHCDVYVFLDDVQFSRGFLNRVQLKEGDRQRWMTVPLEGGESRKSINRHRPSTLEDWRGKHVSLFTRLYEGAPYFADSRKCLNRVLSNCDGNQSLAELSEESTKSMAQAFGLNQVAFVRSSSLGIPGTGTRRLIDICLALGASSYITGHGASRYLDHEFFESHGIRVSYLAYGLKPYPQLTGTDFVPYVSALDCIAMCGPRCDDYLTGSLVPWNEFVNRGQ
mgnify:CR=1 FL=1